MPDDTPVPIGNRIRERREAAGLSQEELGRRYGLSHTSIRYLKTGRWQDPRVSVALLLARVLWCRVEEVFGEEGE